jgi:hypothetical protein
MTWCEGRLAVRDVEHEQSWSEPAGTLIQRNTWWAMFFTELVIAHDDLGVGFSDDETIFLLPEHDPELRDYNWLLAQDQQGPVVFVGIARAKSGRVSITQWASEKRQTFELFA